MYLLCNYFNAQGVPIAIVVINVIKSSPLYKAAQQTVEHVGAVPHQLSVLRRTVHTLTVHDGPFKHVAELCLGTQVVGPHKVHHAPVLQEVVL